MIQTALGDAHINAHKTCEQMKDRYLCLGCQRLTCGCNGSDDSNHCDDCWFKMTLTGKEKSDFMELELRRLLDTILSTRDLRDPGDREVCFEELLRLFTRLKGPALESERF